jgi:hypothetical protein
VNSLLHDKGESVLPMAEPARVLKAEVDSTLKYFFIYLVLGVASAVGFSWFFSQFNAAPDLALMLKTAGMAALFLVILMFQTFFIQSFSLNLILVVLHVGGLLAFFYQPFSAWFIGAALAMLGLWMIAFYKGRQELNANLKFNFWKYSSLTLIKMITGMALFLAFMYAGLYVRAGNVSYQAYKFTVSNTGLDYVVPNFAPDAKVDAFFQDYVRQVLKSQPGYENMSQAERERTTKEIAAQIQAKTAEATDVPAQKNETIVEYTYRLAIQGLEFLRERGLGFLIIGAIIVIIFLAIKTVMFIAQWPILVVTLLIYYALISAGVITIESEPRQKEVAVVH